MPSAVICRICGYDLSSVDLARASYRCPECGEVNIPADPRVAPLSARSWPSPIFMVLFFGWPGLLAAAAVISLAHRPLVPVGAFFGLLGVLESVVWPWLAGSLFLRDRLPQRARLRLFPWLPLGGMVFNFCLILAAVPVLLWLDR